MRLLKSILKFILRLRWPLLLIVMAALVIEAILATVGYPASVRRSLAAMLDGEGSNCVIGELRGEPFTTLNLNDVIYSYELPGGTLKCWLPTSSLGLRRRSLLLFKLKPRLVAIKGGLVDYASKSSPNKRLTIRDLSVAAELSTQDVLRGSASGYINGVNCRVSFELQHGSVLLEAEQPAAEARQSAGSTSSAASETLDSILDALQYIGQGSSAEESDAGRLLSYGKDDANLAVTITGDLSSPDSINAFGDLILDDVIVCSTSIPKLRAAFHYSAPTFAINDLSCVLPQQELVNGSGSLDLKSRTVSGKVDGSISFGTLLALCGQDEKILPSGTFVSQPLKFSFGIPDFPFEDPSAFKADFRIETKNLYLCSLLLDELAVQGSYTQRKITIGKASLQGSPDLSSAITASGEYLVEENTFSASMDCELNIQKILNQLGYATKTVLGGRCPETSVSIKVDPSSLLTDWRKWKLRSMVKQPTVDTGPLLWKDLRIDASIQDGTLRLDEASLALANAPGNRFLLTGEADLQTWIDLLGDTAAHDEPLSASLPMHLRVLHGSTTALDADLRLEVLGDNDGNGIAIAVPEATADLRPELLHELFNAQLKLQYDEFPLAWEKCLGDRLLHTDFTIPQWHPEKGVDSWRLEGHLEGHDVSLLEVPLHQITSDYTVNTTDVVFTGIQGVIADAGTELALDSIAIQYDPLIIAFTNTDIKGAPEPIEPWLYDPGAREVYRKVWTGVKWDSTHAPHFVIPFMRYHELPRNTYEFILHGTADARNARYNDFASSSASCKVDLVLPSPGVTVTDIRVCAPGEDKPLTGTVAANFDNGVSGTFGFDFPEGRINIVRLLQASILPDNKYLSKLKLHPETHFDCRGFFSDNGQFTFGIEGAIQTPRMKYDSIELDDLQGSWDVDRGALRWNLPKAHFFGGELATSGFYDFSNNSGECIAAARKIPLDRLNEIFRPKPRTMLPSVFAQHTTRTEKEWRACLRLPRLCAPPQAGEAFIRQVLAFQPSLPCCRVLRAGGQQVHDRRTMEDNAASTLKGFAGIDTNFRFYVDWASRPLQLQGTARLEIDQADLWRVPLLSSLGSLLLSSDLGRITKLESDIVLRGQRVDFRNILTDGTLISLKGQGNYHIGTHQMKFNISGDMVKSSRIFNWLLSPVAWMVNAELYGTPDNFSWHTTTMRKIFSGSSDSSPNKLSLELNDVSQ